MPRSVSSLEQAFSPMRSSSPCPLTVTLIIHDHSYDIFAINIASTMLGYVYGHSQCFCQHVVLPTVNLTHADQKLSPNQDLGIKVATPVGTLVGQLLFGWLADIVGRKRMCESTPFCSRAYTHLSGFHRWCRAHDYHHRHVWSSSFRKCSCRRHRRRLDRLAVHRMRPSSGCSPSCLLTDPQMGVGIGGDYPLSAVISSEFASTRIRGRMMTAVFASQGWGNFGISIASVHSEK